MSATTEGTIRRELATIAERTFATYLAGGDSITVRLRLGAMHGRRRRSTDSVADRDLSDAFTEAEAVLRHLWVEPVDPEDPEDPATMARLKIIHEHVRSAERNARHALRRAIVDAVRDVARQHPEDARTDLGESALGVRS